MRGSNLLFLILALVSCAPAPQLPSASPEGNFAVLPLSRVRQRWANMPVCDARDKAGMTPSWLVQQSLAANIDGHVREELAEALENQSAGELNSGDYLLQYVGVTYAGRRAILVNGIYKTLASDRDTAGREDALGAAIRANWRRDLLFVCDAGRLQFTALVDSLGSPLRPIRFFQSLGGSKGPGVR